MLRKLRVLLLSAVLFFSGVLPGLAHVSDTSLLRIRVESGRLVIDWNVDLLTLRSLTPLDWDGDGKVQKGELQQAGPVIEKQVRALWQLSVAGERANLGAGSPPEWQGESVEATDEQLQSVHVNLHFERPWKAGPQAFNVSANVFKKLGAKHSVIVSVIQAGDSQQTVLTQDFSGLAYDPAVVARGNSSQLSFLEMVKFGVHHILSGTDHLLFLLTLLVAVGTWRQLLAIVTAFTVAHSVTLGLAVFEVVALPGKLVESAIALSIAWVAIENLVTGTGRKRWKLAFGFGLIHGFGFAEALREMALPQTGLLQSLLLFNVGVEFGQLFVVLPVLPLVLWARRFPWHVTLQKVLSGLALVLALWWLVERLRA